MTLGSSRGCLGLRTRLGADVLTVRAKGISAALSEPVDGEANRLNLPMSLVNDPGRINDALMQFGCAAQKRLVAMSANFCFTCVFRIAVRERGVSDCAVFGSGDFEAIRSLKGRPCLSLR